MTKEKETTRHKKSRLDKKVRAGKATRAEIMWCIRHIGE